MENALLFSAIDCSEGLVGGLRLEDPPSPFPTCRTSCFASWHFPFTYSETWILTDLEAGVSLVTFPLALSARLLR
jgi:hypothetical protein